MVFSRFATKTGKHRMHPSLLLSKFYASSNLSKKYKFARQIASWRYIRPISFYTHAFDNLFESRPRFCRELLNKFNQPENTVYKMINHYKANNQDTQVLNLYYKSKISSGRILESVIKSSVKLKNLAVLNELCKQTKSSINPIYQYLIAFGYLELDKIEEATRIYNELRVKYPQDDHTLLLLMAIQFRQKSVTEAENTWSMIKSISWDAYTHLIQGYAVNRRFDLMLSKLDDAKQLLGNPKDLEVYKIVFIKLLRYEMLVKFDDLKQEILRQRITIDDELQIIFDRASLQKLSDVEFFQKLEGYARRPKNFGKLQLYAQGLKFRSQRKVLDMLEEFSKSDTSAFDKLFTVFMSGFKLRQNLDAIISEYAIWRMRRIQMPLRATLIFLDALSRSKLKKKFESEARSLLSNVEPSKKEKVCNIIITLSSRTKSVELAREILAIMAKNGYKRNYRSWRNIEFLKHCLKIPKD